MKTTGHEFDLLVLLADGKPAPIKDVAEAMVLDMESMPVFHHRPKVSDGQVTLPVPDGSFSISMPLHVAGFGHVWVYADNCGNGYQADEVVGKRLNFAFEAAASRASLVASTEADYRTAGTVPSSEYSKRLSEAKSLLADAREKALDEAACAKLAMASLRESMHAGELLVVEHAKAQIAQMKKRENLLYGCNGFRYPALGEPYAKIFGDLLNFVTLPFYRARTEPEEGKRDYSAIEKILEWTERDGLAVKGHPLVWFHKSGLPDWLASKDREQVKAAHRDYILDAVGRYRERITIWDIINEAHDWANDLDYSQEELVEATRLAAEVTREANPQATRIVNSCCTWSEYVARGKNYSRTIGRPARNVLQYKRDLLSAGVEFEVIGLQMYYPVRDLLEIDRQLERFCKLGKPIHITELGVSSSIEPVEHHPIVDVHRERYWHERAWSESEQADWMEAYYTICYAKPEIQAITWWDFSDPAFIPHGGFVDEGLRPKEAYHRLKKLIQSWS